MIPEQVKELVTRTLKEIDATLTMELESHFAGRIKFEDCSRLTQRILLDWEDFNRPENKDNMKHEQE